MEHEEEIIRTRMNGGRNKILYILAAAVLAGAIIPFQREYKNDIFDDGMHESYKYDVIEFVKFGGIYEQVCPPEASDCKDSFGYLVDALVFSKNGWVGSSKKPEKVLYVSKTKKLYVNILDASRDNKNDLVNVNFKDNSAYEIIGSSQVMSDCFLYGLFCPEGNSFTHRQENVTFNSTAKVKVYTSNCKEEYDDLFGGSSGYNCKYERPVDRGIREILEK